MTRIAQDILYLEGARLLEGDGDEMFDACRVGVPESKANQKYQDKIELGNRYVCGEDPAL